MSVLPTASSAERAKRRPRLCAAGLLAVAGLFCCGSALGQANLSLSMTDTPDPAPIGGNLLYSLIIRNSGPLSATSVTLSDTLPLSVTLLSATPSQGSCTAGTPIVCSLGTVLSGGTASVEILVRANTAGTIVNAANVGSSQPDPNPLNNTATATTLVVTGGTSDVPLTLFQTVRGFVDSTATGGSLRTQPNGSNACAVGATSTSALAGIPAGATVRFAYLYWAGSGATVDSQVTLDGVGVSASRTFQSIFVSGSTSYPFFGGFADVTSAVAFKRNSNYTVGGLTVNTGAPHCAVEAVLAGWSMIVIYEDASVSGKTLVLYDGFDNAQNGSTSYVLTGIYAAAPTEARTTVVVWEGDTTLGGATESLQFNGTALSDALNPVNNVYNSTVNLINRNDTWGVDVDSFDVSSRVSSGDTSATTTVLTGQDLVILSAVLLQVKSNVMVGRVFDDVNYGGGPGRNLATATAAAGALPVRRPNAVAELYDSAGNFLRSTATNASGEYSFAGIPQGDYIVRIVNSSVSSARGGSGWPVQTFRTDAGSGTPLPVTNEVGGANPAGQDAPANSGGAPLGSISAQSRAAVSLNTATSVTNVDFGFNFDTIVNVNDAGQGSLRQFIVNANTLGNAGLAQAGLAAGVETSLFMIPAAQLDARGVALIRLLSPLPLVSGAATSIDGTRQTVNIGDTNAGAAGNPELGATAVGTGADGVEGTADDANLAVYSRPEVEIDGNGQAVLIDVGANNVSVSGLALFNSAPGGHGVRFAAGNGGLLAASYAGARADGSDPGAGSRLFTAARVQSGATADLRDNFIAWTDGGGLWVGGAANVERNDIYRAGLASPQADGLTVEGSAAQTIVIRANRIDRSGAYGIESWGAPGPWLIEDNTVSRSGQGGSIETGGIRLFGSGSTVRRNVVRQNAGAGIVLAQRNAPGSNRNNLISRNAIYANGALGIDLDVSNTGLVNPNGDGVTANDGVLIDTLPNRAIDYPVITAATLAGSSLTVSGFVGSAPGQAAFAAATIELFRANDDGNNAGEVVVGDGQSVAHGEGERYVGTVIADASGNFSTTLTVAGLSAGDLLTATAIDAANNTSEFGAGFTVTGPPGLNVAKSTATIEDPFNGVTDPKAIPGATVLYTIAVSNAGTGPADADSIVITDPIPANATLRVADFDAATSGPVAFVDGAPASGLSYSFAGLGNASDDVSFSDDGGASFGYAPVPDANGLDAAVTHIRINPKGTLQPAGGGGDPGFRVSFKIVVP